MKKLKLAFIAIALLAGVGGAFAMRTDPTCVFETQYYANGSGYVQIWGEYGVTWYCELNEAVTCSFYRPDPMVPVYHPCRLGHFFWITK